MAPAKTEAAFVHPPKIIDMPHEWGSPTDYFNRCIHWAKLNLVIDGPPVMGAYYDGTQMRMFKAKRTAAAGCVIQIHLPEHQRIDYNESEGRLFDQHDRQLKQFLCLRAQDGQEEYVLEWETVKQRSSKVFQYLGATTDAVWSQCRTMAYPFGKQFGRNWPADMGGSKTLAALRRRAGGAHSKPPQELCDLLHYLAAVRNEYQETALWSEGGTPSYSEDPGYPPRVLKQLRNTTINDYGRLINKCREILDILGEPSVV